MGRLFPLIPFRETQPFYETSNGTEEVTKMEITDHIQRKHVEILELAGLPESVALAALTWQPAELP